jgi:hypothetical protein
LSLKARNLKNSCATQPPIVRTPPYSGIATVYLLSWGPISPVKAWLSRCASWSGKSRQEAFPEAAGWRAVTVDASCHRTKTAPARGATGTVIGDVPRGKARLNKSRNQRSFLTNAIAPRRGVRLTPCSSPWNLLPLSLLVRESREPGHVDTLDMRRLDLFGSSSAGGSR